MIRLLPILALLAGCATSASVYEKAAQVVIPSGKSSKAFALCVIDHFTSSIYSLRNDGDHYWIVGQLDAASTVIRWDFVPAAGGSVAELHSSFHIGSPGTGKVRACA